MTFYRLPLGFMRLISHPCFFASFSNHVIIELFRLYQLVSWDLSVRNTNGIWRLWLMGLTQHMWLNAYEFHLGVTFQPSCSSLGCQTIIWVNAVTSWIRKDPCHPDKFWLHLRSETFYSAHPTQIWMLIPLLTFPWSVAWIPPLVRGQLQPWPHLVTAFYRSLWCLSSSQLPACFMRPLCRWLTCTWAPAGELLSFTNLIFQFFQDLPP